MSGQGERHVKVKLRLGKGQVKFGSWPMLVQFQFNVRSRSGQGQVKVTSKSGEGKVKIMSKSGQVKFRCRLKPGQGQVKVRSR